MTKADGVSPGFQKGMGERHARGVWQKLYRPAMTEEDVDWLVTNCAPSRSRAAYLYRKWDDLRENGGDLKNFRREVLLEWRDSLSANRDELFTSAARSTLLDDMFVSYKAINEAVWTCWIRPGRMGYVTGEMESGKTDFMERIAELYMSPGGIAVSCIPLTGEKTGYIYCTRLTEYLRTGCELSLRGISCLNLLDETFFYASGEKPLDPDVRAYRGVLRLTRKLGIATLMASQKDSDILRDVRGWSKFHAEKLDPDRPDKAVVDLQGTIDGENMHFWELVKNIPRTSMPFRSEAIGSFIVDMDPMELLHVLSKADMEENQYQVTLDWLDNRGYTFSRDEKRYLARKMYATGKLSQKDVAEILGMGDSTVSRYLREMD